MFSQARDVGIYSLHGLFFKESKILRRYPFKHKKTHQAQSNELHVCPNVYCMYIVQVVKKHGN